MDKEIKFQTICANYSCNQIHIFDIDEADHDYDCHDTCIIWNDITFYGVPFDLFDGRMQSIYEHNYSDAVKIGELRGYLILCKQMIEEGYDPLTVCDDVDGDLEYAISALSDEDCPLGDNPFQDVYYIHELEMENGYDDVSLKSKIIDELPGLIFKFFHVYPDIFAFYSAPLEYTPNPDEEARYRAMQSIHAQKINKIFGPLFDEQPKEKDNIINFGEKYKFTEDELNMVMRRRYSGSSYPEEAKNKDEYAFYEANGFEEVGDSRLLYKYVGQD